MSRSTLLVLALMAGAMLSSPASAQWKWRDTAGHVQYSDLPPPPNVADKDILQQPSASKRAPARTEPFPESPAASAATAASGALVAPPKVDPELEAKRRALEQEKIAKAKAEEELLAKNRADNCVRAKISARSLEDGVRIARTNAQGEREYLDESARAQELARTRSIMASECK